MKPVSILILCDAGAAGRELLARRDVELGWALSVPEAVEAMERRRPRLVLVREEMAMAFLSRAKSFLQRVPVVVLLEGASWDRRSDYFAAGATALVSAASRARIFECITELTGLSTRFAPRVGYSEVVDVGIAGARLYLEAIELGASGIGLRDFPPSRTGEQVEIGLVMMDPPLTVSGMVVRTYVGRRGPVTEVAFNGLDEAERNRLEAYVSEQLHRVETLPDPVGLTSDILGGTFTLDLLDAFGPEADTPDRWMDLMAERMRVDSEVRAPRWLQRVERELTEVERRALMGLEAPSFARAAVAMRVDLARSQASLEDPESLRESCALALDFCRSLAMDDTGARSGYLGYVSEIRAGILGQIYGWAPTHDDSAEVIRAA